MNFIESRLKVENRNLIKQKLKYLFLELKLKNEFEIKILITFQGMI